MKTLLRLLLITLALHSPALHAQEQPVITSFGNNGNLICEHLQPGTTATVEWASSPAGPWKSNWADLDGVVVDGSGSIQVNVPMFYRVRGTPRETVGIEASSANVTSYENSSSTLQVRLTAQPPANVTVTATSGNTAKATVSPATLTFTPANWNTYQNLTVNGLNDADASDEATSMTLSAPGMYDKVIGVTVLDDEQALDLTSTTLAVNEGGSLSLGVRLAGRPAGNVSVNLASTNAAVATVSPAALTFTPANWNTYQSVTVSGVQDADNANGSAIIMLTASTAPGRNVSVVVNDDD